MKQKKTNWMYRMKLIMMALVLCWGLGSSMQVQAATEAQKEAFKQELMDIFVNVDTSKHNIYKYNLSRTEYKEILDRFYAEEGSKIYGAYPQGFAVAYSMTGSRMYSMTLECTDDGIRERYEIICAEVDEIMAGIEPEMTDIDKILYFHDSIVERTTYGGSTERIYKAGGVFVDGKAVCEGYAKALNVLLHEAGFEQSYVRNQNINHGWSYVKLDGEWYHIDPTWDDTRSPQSGKTARTYLLKNDAEFATNHGTTWEFLNADEASTSTKYSSWFVRDIVGKMCFEDGLWYYYDKNTDMIVRADISTGEKEAVLDCSAWSGESLLDVTGNVVTLMANGFSQSIEIGEGITIPEGDEAVSLPSLEEVDLSDFSNWVSGNYHYQTGTYAADGSRLAVKSYVTCKAGEEYTVSVSNSKYQVLIRELNANPSVVASHNLKSESSFTTNASTKYLAISIYAPTLTGLSYDSYQSLFAAGFEMTITGEEDDLIVVEPEIEVESGVIENDTIIFDQVTSGMESMTPETVGLDLNDFSNWMSGNYHYQTGLYAEDASRICLKDYVPGEAGAEYMVSISNSKYNVLIRELSGDKTVVASHNLTDGTVFTTKANTEYLAVSIYAPSVWGMTYEKYAALFEGGMTVYITTEAVLENDASMEETEGTESEDNISNEKTVEAWDFRNFANWQTGMYHYSTGKYCTYAERICLVDYLEFEGESYVANISNSTYKLLVRELDENQKFIKSVTLADGASYTPSSGAKYLAISLYNATNDWGMNYTKYQQMFAEGFYAELVAK